MKYFIFALLPAVAVLLTSCESTGFSWDAFSEFFTPGVSAETQVRTWDGEQKPHEKNRYKRTRVFIRCAGQKSSAIGGKKNKTISSVFRNTELFFAPSFVPDFLLKLFSFADCSCSNKAR